MTGAARHMSQLDDAIARAAQLPLLDAAYGLWKEKSTLDRAEQPPRPAPRAGANLRDPDVVKQLVRQAFAHVSHERATAHEGPTFDRLKRAHPEAPDDDLRTAIKAALKLEGDCLRHFSSTGADYFEDVRRAVALARQDNPGFREQTYRQAEHDLAVTMR
jgi:hypothetical protein